MSTDKYHAQDSKKGIIKSTSVISAGTLASRILGFIRDVIIAKILGTSAPADIFFVAFRIPNLFRDLVGEGAANSAFVPVISEYESKKDKTEFQIFLNAFYAASFMILSLIVILGILFSPLIVRLIAPGFIEEPEKLKETILLTRIMFPYLLFIGLTAYSMGVLYTFRAFIWPALSPCLLNIAMIISVLTALATKKDPLLSLAIGVLLGGIAQLLLQLKPLHDRGITFHWPKNIRHPGVTKVGKLLVPRIFGSAVYQLNIVVDTFCASLSTIVGPGGIAAIYYSNRIVQFPMGLFSVALASAILPSMAGYVARQNMADFKRTIVFSLENIFLVMLPMTVFLVLLATPITRFCFERGAFNAYSTSITSIAILFYSLGLIGFGGTKIMVTSFHALQDTKTPVKVGFLCLIINVVLNFAFLSTLKVGGIALASSIASTVNFLLLLGILRKRLGGFESPFSNFFYKIMIAATMMGICVGVVWNYSVPLGEFYRLCLVGIAGLAVFAGVCFRLKIAQVQEAVKWILKVK